MNQVEKEYGQALDLIQNATESSSKYIIPKVYFQEAVVGSELILFMLRNLGPRAPLYNALKTEEGDNLFTKEEYEELEGRTRGILFGLCHFHAVMLERRKFGAQGRNMHYPFAVGDLIKTPSGVEPVVAFLHADKAPPPEP